MNIHPKFRKIYSDCSEILKKVLKKKVTLKTEIFRLKKPVSYIPIIDKVLQNYDLLTKIIDETNFLKKNRYFSLIICSEILEGHVNNKFWKVKFEHVKNENILKHVIKSKYLRVNTAKGSYNDMKDLKVSETFIPNVFKLEESTNLIKNEAYKKGRIIVQNIASCIPAFLLKPSESDTIIDTCAAPGNKTAHLSNLMNNKGKIIAVEMNKDRFGIMKRQLKKYGVKNAKLVNSDFLDLSPNDYKKVDKILVDPTCSGSGIHDVYEKDEERIKNLQEFQINILKHAMSFGASRIVYSTCSIHIEEGEDVINKSLIDSEYELIDIAHELKPTESYIEVKNKFLRCNLTEDKQSNGFFIALLQKKIND